MSAALSVSFHGHTHTLIEHGGEPHVAMRPVVEAIGLSWSSQMQRIKAHPVMGTCVLVTNTQMPGDDQRRELFALPLKYLNGWLFGVDSRRIKPELRDTLVAYQRECFDVLDRYWRGGNRVGEQHDSPALAMPPSVNHQADHIVSASRVFRSLMKLGFEARLPRHKVLASANDAALAATGYDLAAVFGIEHELLPPALPAPNPLADTVGRWLDDLRQHPVDAQPRGPVQTPDAYAHYDRWCRSQNQPGIGLPRFVATLKQDHGLHVVRQRIRQHNGTMTGPQSVIYLGAERAPPRGQLQSEWLAGCCWQFWMLANTEAA